MEVKYRNENFLPAYCLLHKFGNKINTGMLLLVSAIAAIIVANSSLGAWYSGLLSVELHLGTDNFNFFSHNGRPMTLLDFINDALMAIFFFSVGLEIKREMLVGELSSFRQVVLPFLGACGGMLVPVILFFAFGKAGAFSPEEMRGMAIPMATDIAFSLGVLSLFGQRVPPALKVFLLALAIVDDIGGIIVIALFYSHISTSSILFLLAAVLVFALLLLGNRLKINSKLFYAVLGLVVWYCFFQAGIHPTIAGVLVAFTVPARPYINIKDYTDGLQDDLNLIKRTIKPSKPDDEILLSNLQIRFLSRIERASDRVISPLQDIEDNLQGLVNFIIMPLFAFANAGVVFDFSGGWGIFTGVTSAVIISLFIGKTLGIFLFTWGAVKLKISQLPKGMNWKNLFGVAQLGGIGFTVALFLAGLSYPAGSMLLNQARLGILAGSLISGVMGYLYLNKSLWKKNIAVKNKAKERSLAETQKSSA